jgi:hypothetical protein
MSRKLKQKKLISPSEIQFEKLILLYNKKQYLIVKKKLIYLLKVFQSILFCGKF